MQEATVDEQNPAPLKIHPSDYVVQEPTYHLVPNEFVSCAV